MKKVLFDTNVVLDVLLDRPPFAEVAAVLFSQANQPAPAPLHSPVILSTMTWEALG